MYVGKYLPKGQYKLFFGDWEAYLIFVSGFEIIPGCSEILISDHSKDGHHKESLLGGNLPSHGASGYHVGWQGLMSPEAVL